MQHSFWQTQKNNRPLFPNIMWSKPEQRAHAGKLLIIGGNKLGFAAAAEAHETAIKTGVGAAKVVLPKSLQKNLRHIPDAIFVSENISGSLSKDAESELFAAGAWSDGALLIGDTGRSSETAIVYEAFITTYKKPLTITRDAIDLVKNCSDILVEREHTLLVVSFAQLQKIFQNVYYPKILTFSMQLSNLVETLHKFTTSYPVALCVLHKEHIISAYGGDVVTMEWESPMSIWRGSVAAEAASFWLWSPTKPLESVTTSWLAAYQSNNILGRSA